MNLRYYVNHSMVILYRWLVLILLVYIFKLIYDSKIRVLPLSSTVEESTTTYDWFVRMRYMFMDLGEEDAPVYENGTQFCNPNTSGLGPITVNKTTVKLRLLGQQLPFVRAGGYYAPLTCRSRHRVAVLVPFRGGKSNLAIFLRHMHSFLKRQFLEYRIFVMQKYGPNKFNRGALFNIGFLESQRFGDWHCYIFHDIHLLPLDDRILYSCPLRPIFMSATADSQGFQTPHPKDSGWVTVLTAAQFETVNGYSNLYPDSSSQDDIFVRFKSHRVSVVQYNTSIARYVLLPHETDPVSFWRTLFIRLPKRSKDADGLRNVKYKLLNGKKRKLYTYIFVDLSPME